jgi:hypothetical protein
MATIPNFEVIFKKLKKKVGNSPVEKNRDEALIV